MNPAISDRPQLEFEQSPVGGKVSVDAIPHLRMAHALLLELSNRNRKRKDEVPGDCVGRVENALQKLSTALERISTSMKPASATGPGIAAVGAVQRGEATSPDNTGVAIGGAGATTPSGLGQPSSSTDGASKGGTSEAVGETPTESRGLNANGESRGVIYCLHPLLSDLTDTSKRKLKLLTDKAKLVILDGKTAIGPVRASVRYEVFIFPPIAEVDPPPVSVWNQLAAIESATQYGGGGSVRCAIGVGDLSGYEAYLSRSSTGQLKDGSSLVAQRRFNLVRVFPVEDLVQYLTELVAKCDELSLDGLRGVLWGEAPLASESGNTRAGQDVRVFNALLDFQNTTGSARKWWIAFTRENRHRLPTVVRLQQELIKRRATITEFFLAYVYSNTDNILANLWYLDYTRLKKEEEAKKRKEREQEEEVNKRREQDANETRGM